MIDETLLDGSQRSGIRIWTRMIREADEERAVRMLTRIVMNLAGNKAAIDAALKATAGKPMN